MNQYGVRESNNISDAAYDHTSVDHSEGDVPLSDPRLVHIDRIRLLTERGLPFMDVSYVYGTLKDGRHVRVDLGEYQLSRQYKSDLIRLAKAAGRFGKGMGMLDDSVISILWG
jgi:hypothetical protein